MKLELWLLFVSIWTASSVPIGPNALNCISTSINQGFRHGLFAVVGVIIAGCIFLTLAFTGLAAAIAANDMIYETIRWFGVAYLAWLGLKMLTKGSKLNLEKSEKIYSPRQLVYRAIVISLSNPKAIFMWLVVFSQFFDPSQPVAPQLAVLGSTGLIIPAAVYSVYCALGSSARTLFAGNRKRWLDRLVGLTYLGFASGLALSDLRR